MRQTRPHNPPLRATKRLALKAAIAAGRDPYTEGHKDGTLRGQEAGFQQGFRAGVGYALNRVVTAAFGLEYA